MKQIIREGYYRVKDIPKGEFIKRTRASKKIYRKRDYDKTAKAFWCDDYNDISVGVLLSGSAKVYAGFDY